MNINFFLILIYLLIFPFYSSMGLFIPLFIINYCYRDYIDFAYVIKNLYWSSFSFVFQMLLNPKIYVNSLELFEDITNHPNQQNIILSNHISECDFMLLSYIFNNFKNMSTTKTCCVAKKEVGYKISGCGIISLFTGDIFLNRNIHLDNKKLSSQNDSNLLVIYPEGTVYTKEKKYKSDEYCKKNNLPIYNYHLYPRITGIKTILETNNKFKYFYDITIVYGNINKRKYGIVQDIFHYTLNDYPNKIFLNISKHKINSNTSNLKNQIENIFENKDDFIKKFEINNNKFISIKYNYFNGLISLYIVCCISIISWYLWYKFSVVKYLYTIESIFYLIYFYYFC